MLQGAPPKQLARAALPPGFRVASVWPRPAASRVEKPSRSHLRMASGSARWPVHLFGEPVFGRGLDRMATGSR